MSPSGADPVEVTTEQLQDVHIGSAIKIQGDGASAGASNPSSALMPELPPALASARGKTSKEILAELNKSPLFMTELEENDDIAALQALAYEGTPVENARDFKERGNECFREGKWADAKEFYTKGITILATEARRRARGEPPAKPENDSSPAVSDAPEDVEKERDVLEWLYVNRAACHVKLQNYGSVVKDCGQALLLSSGSNVKALFRSAKALLELDKVLEAEDACARALAIDPSSKTLVDLSAEIAQRKEKLTAKQKADAEREATAKRRRALLRWAIRQRGYTLRSTAKPPEMEDARIQLHPDPDDAEGSALVFPTMVLYPADLQTDFIKAFSERDCMDVHLSYLLPLPWDKDSAYTQSGAECYMATAKGGGLVKLGKKVPLAKALAREGMEVVDELVQIYVLPKGKVAAKWVKDFKAMRPKD